MVKFDDTGVNRKEDGGKGELFIFSEQQAKTENSQQLTVHDLDGGSAAGSKEF